MELLAVGLQGVDLALSWDNIAGPVKQNVELAKQTIRVWRESFDPFIWLAGSLLALVPGTFAAWRWWHYRKSRLPLRLRELLAKQQIDVETSRRALLSAVKNPFAERTSVTPPLFMVPALRHSLRNLSWSGWLNPFALSSADAEMESALAEIEEQLRFCEKVRKDCKQQEATAFLVKGALATARAQAARNAPEIAISENRNALNFFVRALELNSDDIEALQYVAHQHRVLGEDDLAISKYENLTKRTENGDAEARLIGARAFRFLGEIYERQFDKSRIGARLTKAGSCLDSSLSLLPDTARGQLDHAAIYEVLGRVKEKDGAVQLPGTYYGNALSIYGELKRVNPRDSEAAEGCIRCELALKNFRETGQSRSTNPN